jgi:uncharacterized coiled-coil protein SlyX
MPDVYKKIEKRILNLKGKEELWKSRYREIAKQIKELVDSTSERMKQIENTIKNFESRIEEVEAETRKSIEMNQEMLRLMDKRITEMSEFSKGISEKIEENDNQLKKIKADNLSQVNIIITRHEKTFDSILEKINLATKRIENELQKGEGLYEKMETAKRFMESYIPPDPPKLDPSPKRPNGLHETAESPSLSYQPKSHAVQQKSIPPAPAPQRFQVSEAPFIYEPGSPIASPENFVRRAQRKPIDMDDLDDDDLDMDELVSGNIKGFNDSVESMNSSVSSITEKLASIEDKVAKMQTVKNPGLERLDDKIRMYSDSVTDIHSRMGTVEKALRDGMTPMMETMKLLTETVKSLKEESKSKPSLAKPSLPMEPKKVLI